MSMYGFLLVTSHFPSVLNCECTVSDFHNFVGANTERFAPLYQPRVIYNRSYKYFDDDIFVEHVSSIPFHVAEIFDDVDDMPWFTGKLLLDTIEEHARVRCKKIKLWISAIFEFSAPQSYLQEKHGP